MNAKAKFAAYCGLTCLGGSEKRECKCERPTDCEMASHPYFATARDEAAERMMRLMRAGLPTGELP